MISIDNVAHGAVLNHNHGVEGRDGLEIIVAGGADPRTPVQVNGVAAEQHFGRFSAKVLLDRHENEIVVAQDGFAGRVERRIKVLYDRNSFLRYNFFIDDNIFCFTDIARTRPKSLFDHFYFRRLKEIHDKYDLKVTLNCFYRNDHHAFELKDFPDCYRGEFRDNSDWLKLSFHSYSEFPDRPYQHATAAKLAADYDRVHDEIERFAGEKSFIPPIVIHWAMLPPDNYHVLTERGMKVFSGQFTGSRTYVGEKAGTQVADIGYFQEMERALYLSEYSIQHDFDYGLTWTRGRGCCNLDTVGELREKLAAAVALPCGCETIGSASHEQYSFPYYANYIPDHLDRIEFLARFMHESCVKPVFFAEGFMGSLESQLN